MLPSTAVKVMIPFVAAIVSPDFSTKSWSEGTVAPLTSTVPVGIALNVPGWVGGGGGGGGTASAFWATRAASTAATAAAYRTRPLHRPDAVHVVGGVRLVGMKDIGPR